MPAANTNVKGTHDQLTEREKKRLAAPALGTAFDQHDRIFPSYGHGGVFDYGHMDAKNMHEMLTRDGKARALEAALTLPLRGADHEISGPNKEFVTEHIPNLDLVIDQMTSACVFRKAFFEKVWKYEDGVVSYDKLAYRPPTSCAAWYDEDTGDLKGFRQRTRVNLNRKLSHAKNMAWAYNQNRGFNKIKDEPGWAYIPIEKSFIYVHGLHRDPVRGISDLEVAWWAYETRQKIMFLWFQFLENTSLPKTVVYGQSQTEANEQAENFSAIKSSGVLGLVRDREGNKPFDTIDVAGQGAQQFQAAVQYLESMMTQSVLASFMDLPNNSTTGSFALSADQSEFFLASRQAVADEIAQCINRNLFGPLIHYNFGDIELPKIEIGPLSNRQTERALNVLNSLIVAPQLNVPQTFVAELVKYTASYLGLNEDEIARQIDAYAAKREQQDEEQRQVQLDQAKASAEATRNPPMLAAQQQDAQKQSGGSAGKAKKAASGGRGRANLRSVNTSLTEDDDLVRDAVEAAYDLVALAESGYDPKDLLVNF